MHIFHNNKSEREKAKGDSQRIKSEVGPGSYNIKKFDMSYDLDYKGQPFPKESRFRVESLDKKRALAYSVFIY